VLNKWKVKAHKENIQQRFLLEREGREGKGGSRLGPLAAFRALEGFRFSLLRGKSDASCPRPATPTQTLPSLFHARNRRQQDKQLVTKAVRGQKYIVAVYNFHCSLKCGSDAIPSPNQPDDGRTNKVLPPLRAPSNDHERSSCAELIQASSATSCRRSLAVVAAARFADRTGDKQTKS
jgi:hypothetical protein